MVKTFNCPSCGAQLSINAVGHTAVIGCQSCGSVVDAQDENHQIISRAKQRAIATALPIGSTGKMRGTVYRVVGMLRRGINEYEWDEYLLFNPQQGFRWLVEYYGHWNFIKMLRNRPEKVEGRTAVHLGTRFAKFQMGRVKTLHVLGELYWEAKVGDIATCTDFISPPEMLSLEETPGEQMWSRGEYVEPGVVKEAFNLDAIPSRKGISPNQPSRMAETKKAIGTFITIFLSVIILSHIAFSFFRAPKQVFDQWYTYVSNDPEKVKVTPPVELKGHGNVVVTSYAQVHNSWLSLDLQLTDENTGDTYQAEKEISYYSGYDSDGSWQEGSWFTKAIFPGVKAGTYTLSIEPSADASISVLKYHVKMQRNLLFGTPLFFAIVAVLIFPTMLLLRHHSFEQTRWQDSDYPYSSDWGAQ